MRRLPTVESLCRTNDLIVVKWNNIQAFYSKQTGNLKQIEVRFACQSSILHSRLTDALRGLHGADGAQRGGLRRRLSDGDALKRQPISLCPLVIHHSSLAVGH